MSRWLPLVFFGIGLAGCTSATSKEPINLAHLVPLSGQKRELGRQAQQAVLLAVEEINADDKGVLGRPLVVRQIDTHGEAETAQGETVRLLSLQRMIAVITGPEPELAQVVLRTAHPYTTTIVVPGELAEPPQSEGVICLAVNPRKRGEMLAHYAANELKAQRAVVLTEKRGQVAKTADKPESDGAAREAARADKANPVGASIAAGFLDGWPRAARSSAEEWQPVDWRQDKELPKRLADSKADAALVAASVADFLTLRARCEAAKCTVPLLYGGEDVGSRPLQTNTPGPDVYLATLLSPENLPDKAKAFAKKYEERFHEPPELAAFQAYDAIRLVAETIQQKNSASPADLRAALNDLHSFEGLLGTVTWKDHQTKRQMYLVHIHEKDPPVAKPIKADE
jgi:ABC-type branched-subunit amino acid transport system substrate-binding protein